MTSAISVKPVKWQCRGNLSKSRCYRKGISKIGSDNDFKKSGFRRDHTHSACNGKDMVQTTNIFNINKMAVKTVVVRSRG